MSLFLICDETAGQLASLYRKMDLAYNRVARMIGFSCEGCNDNCCDSWFQHHTYLEWWYLWRGLKELDPDILKGVVARSEEYCRQAEAALKNDDRPQIMCPLNQQGLCMVYRHRLLVCRTHGVPAFFIRPDGEKVSFPGCFRCQKKRHFESPSVDRTKLLAEMANLEQRFLAGNRGDFPRLSLTLAEMVVLGPPEDAISKRSCSPCREISSCR